MAKQTMGYLAGMKERIRSRNRYLIKAGLILVTLLYLKSGSLFAQLDSLKWINSYANHSVVSRDNFSFAEMLNKESLVISGTTENDFTNYDANAMLLGNDVNTIWEKRYSSEGNWLGYDIVKGMTIDSSGNVFITGISWKGGNDLDPFLIKRDQDGNLLWEYFFRNIDGIDPELSFFDIETDENGNCFMLAGVNTYSVTDRTLIFKFDKDGNINWYKKSGLNQQEKIMVDENQDVFVICYRDETYTRNTIIQKYSNDGNLLFEQRYPGIGESDLIDAKIDRDKNLWMFSDYSDSYFFLDSNWNVSISKFDPSGNLIKGLTYDTEYHNKEKVCQVQSFNDSAYLVGIESNSKDNGIDNLFIVVNNDLEIIDSLRFDSKWHNNDYLTSFDQTENGDIIITGITFTDSKNSFPFIHKIRDFKETEWLIIPSIAERYEIYPKKVFVDKSGSVFLIGDAEMTIRPETGLNTHTNIFVSKYNSSGSELLTREFSGEGKSDIVGKNVKLDSQDNIYVSGIDQYGPDFLYPDSYYEERMVLHKYSSGGALEWNKKINLQYGRVDFLDHFITGDSLITVVGCYGWKTLLYSFDKNGAPEDSTLFDGSVKSIAQGDNGNFYLVSRTSPDVNIYKFDSKLKLIDSYTFPVPDIPVSNTYFKNGYIYVTSVSYDFYNKPYHDVYKFDLDLNQIWKASLSTTFEYISKLVVDSSDNIFISGRNKNSRLLKINPVGAIQWSIVIDNLEFAGHCLDFLSTGDIIMSGSSCGSTGCTPTGLALISPDGVLKKFKSVMCYTEHYLIDKSDNIYLFDIRNHYQKYTPDLDLMVDDTCTTISKGYNLYINDVRLDSRNNIVITGSFGVEWYHVNGVFSWNTLVVAKTGQVNCLPRFLNTDIRVRIHPEKTLVVNSPAIDYDTINFSLLTPQNWISLDEKTGSLSLAPLLADTGYYEVVLKVTDNNGGHKTNTVYISVGNEAPHFVSSPITSADADKIYSYKAEANDPDEDAISFRIQRGPSWLDVDNTGLFYGTPAQQDTGHYQVELICYDNFGGEGSQIYDIQIIPGASSGIDDKELSDKAFVVFPVPASGSVYVRLNQPLSKHATIRVADIYGKIISDFSSQVDTDKTVLQLNVAGILAGIYFLLINIDEDKSFCKKIIIQ